jgi:hypothetical protein
MFKLPIQYVEHQCLSDTVCQDLELTPAHGLEPICHKIFHPTTEEAEQVSVEWIKYYTTDSTFLKESVHLFKQPFESVTTTSFITKWKELKNNKEFKTKYHYIESAWLSSMNYSSALLFWVSVYFVSSPIICLLTPIILMLMPFAMLHSKDMSMTWENYYVFFKQVAMHHSIGRLFFKFGTSTPDQRIYLILGSVFFGIQVYANIYNFYTFYHNIRKTMDVLRETQSYLKNTISSMESMEQSMSYLTTYTDFVNDMKGHKEVLQAFLNKVHVTLDPRKIGILRAHFYELYDNKELNESLEYSVHYHGYLQNVQQMNKNLKRRMNECSFGNETVFKRAYYPIPTPIKNSYSMKNTIITGPNASGKTTFIKTLMINTILSQQLGCGFYKSATIHPYDTFFSYINIPDTSGRDSLFQAEARRCKEIIDYVSTQKRILCIFDELFSGTNPKEATASTISLLSHLTEYKNFTFLLTTHFTDVCEQLKNPSISMYRMKTDVSPLKYHYKIERGISYVRGGHLVLKQMGFPDSILTNSVMCGELSK